MSQDKTILRIFSCGSVDDGKSTLIGRILYDCGTLYEDQLRKLEQERTSEGLPDFASLLDGLMAEQEQAITIDVAYRSFSTAKRRYIVADSPGHEQYTRNMVTAATHAQAALILVDAERAQQALLPQTTRHTYISSLIGIPDIIFVINKMDHCAYSQEVFESVAEKCRTLIKDMKFKSAHYVPVSALRGDNVRFPGENMPWYNGPALMDILENLEPAKESAGPLRLPVQWVARTPGFRGLSGTLVSGSVRVGQTVLAQPSGMLSRVKRIAAFDGDLQQADCEDAVCIELSDERDISRGEILVAPEERLEIADQFAARVVWFNEPQLVAGRSYIFRQANTEAQSTITELSLRLDIDSLSERPAHALAPNDIGRIKFALDKQIPFAPYEENRDLGSFLLIDRLSGNTLGGGMIEYALRRSHNIFWHNFELNKATLAAQKSQKPYALWFSGLSGSGKSTLANLLAKELFGRGKHVYILDGDNLRHGLNRDLGFTENDRAENIRRAGEVSRLMVDAGLIVLATFISPYENDRLAVRERFAAGEFFELFVDTPLEECIRRDPKGLYKKALSGELPNFTGISAPFEAPTAPDLHIDGTRPLDKLVAEVLRFCEKHL